MTDPISILSAPWPSTGRPPEHGELLGFRVNLAARLLSKEFNRVVAPSGVGVGQWPVMLVLAREGECTQTFLARDLALEQPTVANTLKRLERDGLVQRRPDPGDGRRTLVRLTAQGRRLLPGIARLADEVNSSALAGLSSREVAALGELLQRVIDTLINEDGSSPDSQ